MLAETFLNKRYQAGRDEEQAKILKFIAEHPDATAAEIRDFIQKSRDQNGRNGKVE